MKRTAIVKQMQMVYRPPQFDGTAVKEGPLDYMVPCPICDRRAIDFSELSENLILLRYKCPHCRKLVVTPLTAVFCGWLRAVDVRW